MQYFQKSGKEQHFLKMMRSVDRARGFGDYYGFVLVAQGSCDLMVDYGVHEWDIAGLKVIVEEAGGRFTDWNGGRRSYAAGLPGIEWQSPRRGVGDLAS